MQSHSVSIALQDISLTKALTSASILLSLLSARNKTAWDDYRFLYKTITALNIIFKKPREEHKITSNYNKINYHTIYSTIERIITYSISFLVSIFVNTDSHQIYCYYSICKISLFLQKLLT